MDFCCSFPGFLWLRPNVAALRVAISESNWESRRNIRIEFVPESLFPTPMRPAQHRQFPYAIPLPQGGGGFVEWMSRLT
jgi:hypothetical protein